jgi:hypothetical protein
VATTPTRTDRTEDLMMTHYQRTGGIEGVALEQQEVLFQPKTNKFVLLNPNAKLVFAALSQPRSAAQLCAALAAGGAAATAVDAAVAQLLADLLSRGLVQVVAAAPAAPMAAQPVLPWHAPALRDVTEEEVLAAFQMSAAEISAASCWWFSCSTGCP